MSSSSPGAATSISEVTNLGPHGFWFLVDDCEYFVPYSDYPEFRSATVAQIYQMERLSPRQLHWPALDIDIELDALEKPEKFPLAYKH